MKIYIGATFDRRGELHKYRDRLWLMGHEVISTWLDEVRKPDWMDHDTFYKKLAIKDISEVLSSDLFICETGTTVSEGKNTELGVALGSFQKKLIYIIGEQRSVFHQLADLTFDNWDECLAFIGGSSAIHTSVPT